jgi:protein-disulfide isomerase
MMRPNAATVSNVAFSLACFVFVLLGAQRLKDAYATQTISPSRGPLVEDVSGLNMVAVNAEWQGDPRTSLVLVEFSDFQCPFCGQYARDTYQALKREFIDAGHVRYAFMNFPLERLHPLAWKAHEAAACAGMQGKFWAMHGRLFSNQQLQTLPDLMQHAGALRLKEGAFASCLEGSMHERIAHQVAEGEKLGVKSTPTFFIGRSESDGRLRLERKIVGAQPTTVFRTALHEAGRRTTVSKRYAKEEA